LPLSSAHLASSFAELLEPLDLVEKYSAAFSNSGIPFEVCQTVEFTQQVGL